jgi:hypothetical protein
MFLKNIRFFLAPENIAGSGGSGGIGSSNIEENTNLNDDINFLADDSDGGEEEKEDGKEKSQKEEEDEAIKKDEELLGDDDDKEEKEEEKEEEDEEEEEKKGKKKEDEEEEEEKEEADPLKAATYASIKKKYPNFFKDFPQAKNEIFAAEAFRRIFPSVEDAKSFKAEAEEAIGNFTAVREMVEKGEVDSFLSEVKGISEDSYKTFIANFMPALYGNDEKSYYAIATPIVRTAIRNIFTRGTKQGGKKGGTEDNFGQNLVNAAIVLHQAIFDNDDVEAEDKPLVTSREGKDDKKDPEKEKFEKERKEFYAGKYKTLHTDVYTHISTTIREEIKKGLNQSLPSYISKKLIDDIFTEIDRQVAKDEVHINSINALWQKEQRAGFTGQEKDRIINAVLSRARPLIPVIRKKIAAEAMKDFRGSFRLAKGNNTNTTKEANSARRETSSRSSSKPEKKDLRKTAEVSDLDILNMD